MMSKPQTPLAILGGDPAFTEPVGFARPNLGDREAFLARMSETLDRRSFTNHGPLVRELEGRLQEFLQVRHCIAVTNGTIGLELGLRALEVQGPVVVPAFTFVGTAHAARWLGLEVVLADVDPTTHNLDLSSLAAALDECSDAVIGVHLWGRPCATEALEAFCRERGLKLIFDAAHALACTHGGRSIGGFGDLEVFSFHATKFVTAFEGGAITTNDDALAKRLRAMLNFGMPEAGRFELLGTNGKMSDASAAMALTSLDALPSFVEANRANFEAYREALAPVPGLRLIAPAAADTSNYQYVVIEVDAEAAGLSADQLVLVLAREQVQAKRYFTPGLHRVPPYCDEPAATPVPLPGTESLAERTLLLPTGTTVTPEIATVVARILGRAVESASQVREALRSAST